MEDFLDRILEDLKKLKQEKERGSVNGSAVFE